jgi:phosphoglycerate dehydrogenase-like enzyme
VSVLILAPNIGSDLSFLDEFGGRIEILDANRPGADVDALLLGAEVALVGFPVPAEVAARAPRLRWVHHTQAGVSNLFRSDLWTSEILLTSTRGDVGARAIAEYAIAGMFFFARGIDTAVEQKRAGRFTRDGYAMTILRGATVGIVGLGGIGREVARIAAGLGMRVIATRRTITSPQHGVDGVDLVLPAPELHTLLRKSDFVVVCSQLTDETRGMFGAAAFAEMKPGGVFVNIARGEEVDEDALVDALHRGHLRGALLDVHAGEPDRRPPHPGLLETPNVVLTPHISPLGDPDLLAGARQLFVENLRRYLEGAPLLNVVDRARGY